MTNYIDPYGALPPPSPVAKNIFTVYQGSTLEIFRRVTNPDGSPAKPGTCHLEFTIVSHRYSTEIIFQANWDKNIFKEVADHVKIVVPSGDTSTFLRGPLLYSLAWYDMLRNVTVMIEEGGLLVEYAANAPNPEIPYNNVPPDSLNADQTASFL